MNLLSIFTQAIRRATADAVRAGIADGIKSVLGDQPLEAGQADEAETACRLLLLPGPEPEVPARRRKAE